MRLTKHNIPRPNTSNKATGSIFTEKSRELLQFIFDGVIHLEEPNKETNTSVTVALDSESSILTIAINELGEFKISCDDTKSELNVFSPVSSAHTYVYFESDNEWKSVLDGHLVIQLLATEINAHCQGYPRF